MARTESIEDVCPLLTSGPGLCQWCGKVLKGRQSRWCSKKCRWDFVANHRFTSARKRIQKRCSVYRCESCGELTERLEVNHKEPCRGNHGKFGCWHHLENLEGLCRPCHKVKTDEQRARGWT